MPKVSPKKSIEGALGGLEIASIFATWFAMDRQLIFESWILTLLFTMLLSVMSQSGDLIASKFKREVGIKDFSNLFPGHGGILDRFDSILFAAAYFTIILWVF